MRVSKLVCMFGASVVFLTACADTTPADEVVAANRPAEWASPLNDIRGLPNLFQVSDELYRGGRPEDEGFVELKRLGLKTVVNLQTFHSDRQECDEAGLRYFHIAAQAWEGEDEEVIEFLKVVSDPANQPVFVHCLHGADRTGVMSAAYRIVVQGWSKEEAIREMTEGGFGFHGIWQNLIEYVEDMNVERIRELSGISSDN